MPNDCTDRPVEVSRDEQSPLLDLGYPIRPTMSVTSRRSKRPAALTAASLRAAGLAPSRRGSSVVSFVTQKTATPSVIRRRSKNPGITSRTSSSRVQEPAAAGMIIRRPRSNRTHVETFSDYFSGVDFGSSTTQGSILVNIDESLASFGNRIATLAQLFQRFRFRKLRIRFITGKTTNSAGSLIMSHFDDSTYALSGVLQLGNSNAHAVVSALSEAADSVQFPVWAPSVDLQVRCKRDWLYTDRLQAAGGIQQNMASNGRFIVAIVSGVDSSLANTGIGTLYVDGEIEFSCPVFNPLAAVTNTIYTIASQSVGANSAIELVISTPSTSALDSQYGLWTPTADAILGDVTLHQGYILYLSRDNTAEPPAYRAFLSPQDFLANKPITSVTGYTGATLATGQAVMWPNNLLPPV